MKASFVACSFSTNPDEFCVSHWMNYSQLYDLSELTTNLINRDNFSTFIILYFCLLMCVLAVFNISDLYIYLQIKKVKYTYKYL